MRKKEKTVLSLLSSYLKVLTKVRNGNGGANFFSIGSLSPTNNKVILPLNHGLQLKE